MKYTNESDKYDGPIEMGLSLLQNAKLLVAHNGIGFDALIIKQLYNIDLYDGDRFFDTWIASQVLNYRRPHKHGLAGWGEWLKYHKGNYDDWSHFSETMMDYCVRDVKLNSIIYRHLLVELGNIAEKNPLIRKGLRNEMAAAKFDRIDVISFLLEKGADCSQLCRGNTCNALHRLIDFGQKEYTKRSVEICKQLFNEMSLEDIHLPYDWSMADGDPTMLDLLLEVINPNYYCKQLIAIFKEKKTPRSVFRAIYRHDADLVAELLNNGSDIAILDDLFGNVLHIAAMMKAPFAMFELLLNHSSMPKDYVNGLDLDGMTPLDQLYRPPGGFHSDYNTHAEREGIADLLLSRGARVTGSVPVTVSV